MDFNGFTKQLGNIYRETVSNLFDKTGIMEEDSNANHSPSKSKKKVASTASKALHGRKTSQDVQPTQAATSLSPYMSRRDSIAQPSDSRFNNTQSRFAK